MLKRCGPDLPSRKVSKCTRDLRTYTSYLGTEYEGTKHGYRDARGGVPGGILPRGESSEQTWVSVTAAIT